MQAIDSARSKVYLISGGCRSGKSNLALKFAQQCRGRKVFLATAQAFDAEMQARIERHKMERNTSFETFEYPLASAQSLQTIGRCEFLLLDCLTLWVSNQLGQQKSDKDILTELENLLYGMREQAKVSLIVSNEVGMGIVPENRLARRYRDLIGLCHQTIAEQADECFLAIMGKSLALSKLAAISHEELKL